MTKPPINVTFELTPHPPPNEHWYTVIPVLSWEADSHRMSAMDCTQRELEALKNATCGAIAEFYTIKEVTK